jgi:hypothetical protein
MTLQPLPSEFPYKWGKFDFLFYQCTTPPSIIVIVDISSSQYCKSVVSLCKRQEKKLWLLWLYNLKGRVEVTIGKEGHKFIEGPFNIFGEQILEQVSRETVPLGSKSFNRLVVKIFPSVSKSWDWWVSKSLNRLVERLSLREATLRTGKSRDCPFGEQILEQVSR